MFKRSNLYDYQNYVVDHIKANPYCGPFLDMGLGKTASTLTAIVDMKEAGETYTWLLIAPKRVCLTVWRQECEKWEHLTGKLSFSLVMGTEKQRKAALPPHVKADVYVINVDNVQWLMAHFGGHRLPFDGWVLDELSKFKSPKSGRFKALRKVRPFAKRVIGLTGTPTPNGLIDLWSQLFLLDQGERLGKTVGEYRRNYFQVDKSRGDVVYSYKLKKEENPILGEDINQVEIYDRIRDICLSMKAEDYLNLPPLVDRAIQIPASSEVLHAYETFERDQVLRLAETEITALNAAALSNKLMQYANGAVYDENKQFHEVHNLKLEALEEIIDEVQGKPVLVFYAFEHDRKRILKRFKHLKTSRLETEADIDDWNAGKVDLAVVHPASAGHGLNLQFGGNVCVWFGFTWSLELYQQAIKRLLRQGQKAAHVLNFRLVCDWAIDVDVIAAIERKEKGQDALLDAVKARIDKWRSTLTTL